ncbi:hypothetical protein G6F60_015765 [Rhizopus arrhizus]|nr:hypothetical protein G6F60_015765 [Rhizopus arrhizus]
MIRPREAFPRLLHDGVALLQGFAGSTGKGQDHRHHGGDREQPTRDGAWAPQGRDQQLDVHMCAGDSSQVACEMHL